MDVSSVIKTWKTTRFWFLDLANRYDNDQLNVIPHGFNNNLIWHLGHVISVQDTLIYKSTGVSSTLPDDLRLKYKPGTRPENVADGTEIDLIKSLLLAQIDWTEKDMAQQLFGPFQERTLSTGYHLGSLEDAFVFNNFHEGLHMGYFMGIKKLV